MATPVGETHRLHKRAPDCQGLAVDESRLTKTLRVAFDDGQAAPRLADRLAGIAKAFQGGELAKAQLLGLYLKLSTLDDTQIERLATTTALRKGFDPDEPRVPSGSGRASGQWTRDGGEVAETSSEDARPDAKAEDRISRRPGKSSEVLTGSSSR